MSTAASNLSSIVTWSGFGIAFVGFLMTTRWR